MNYTFLMNALVNLRVIDIEKLTQCLRDGTARRARNVGEKTYQDLCKACKVPPHVQEMTTAERIRSFMEKSTRQITRYEARVRNLKKEQSKFAGIHNIRLEK